MQCVLFTKLFKGRSVEEIGRVASELGFDGVDLLIRPGHQVVPDEPAGIDEAVSALARRGLAVPMATTDLTDPAGYPADEVLRRCAGAGIGLVRLGYWTYDAGAGYDVARDAARRHLDRLERLAGDLGLRLAIQLHGGTVHASGALARSLLDGRDPARIGAYPDPGNQAVQDGREDWRMTFDVLGPWLCCVGVKNGGWFPSTVRASGQRAWLSDWLALAEGMVPWDEILAHLARIGFDGLLSFHSHYEVPYEQALAMTAADLGYVRRLLAGSVAA